MLALKSAGSSSTRSLRWGSPEFVLEAPAVTAAARPTTSAASRPAATASFIFKVVSPMLAVLPFGEQSVRPLIAAEDERALRGVQAVAPAPGAPRLNTAPAAPGPLEGRVVGDGRRERRPPSFGGGLLVSHPFARQQRARQGTNGLTRRPDRLRRPGTPRAALSPCSSSPATVSIKASDAPALGESSSPAELAVRASTSASPQGFGSVRGSPK